MTKVLWLGMLVALLVDVAGDCLAQSGSAASAVQVPASVQNEVLAIQDRFFSALEEECPSGKCFPIGCDVGRFLTLDEEQSSSLPGLESGDPKPSKVQYKLASVRCEFTYEATLTEEAIAALRQRLSQRVKSVGVQVNLLARKLDPKAANIDQGAEAVTKPGANYRPDTWYGALFATFLPFLPWFVAGLLIILGLLLLIWALRYMGKKQRDELLASQNKAKGELSVVNGQGDHSPLQVINRIKGINELIGENPRLAEIALKAELDAANFAALSMFLRHFGPQYLSSFKDRAEYKDTLAKLAQHYKEQARDESAAELWQYLNKLERSLIAAKVQVDQEPLEDEFAFLAVLSVEELVGILKEVTEQEAVAAVAYAPRVLRERFFSQTNPSFTVNFIEQLTQVDKLPDTFVREAAVKMRNIYYAKAGHFKIAQVDKYPLLEQALNALDPEKRKQLLHGMTKDNPNLLRGIAPTVFLDESLTYLSDSTLTEAFLTGDPIDLAEFLLSVTFGKSLFERLDKRIQESMLSHLRWGRAPDLRRAGIARQAIADYVKHMDARGLIDLRKINEKILF